MTARLATAFLFVAVFLLPASASDKKEWVKLSDCRYLENPDNDGDSFHVRAGDKEFTARLYYVDAPRPTFGKAIERTIKVCTSASRSTKR